MSKGLLNEMVLKNLFEDVDGAELLPSLVESGVITKEQVEEYFRANIKSRIECKFAEDKNTTYSIIENGVLVEFDERDLNRNGAYIVPRCVHTIETHAFYKCYNLRKVHLGKDVVEIGMKAFFECKNLQSVTMTNSVRKMGGYTFTFCGRNGYKRG